MLPRRHWRLMLFWVMLVLALAACGPTPGPVTPLPDVVATQQLPDSIRLFIIYDGDVSATWAGQVRTGIVETLVRDAEYRVGENLTLGEYQLPSDVGTMVASGTTAIADAITTSQRFNADVVITVGNQATRQVILAYPDPNQRFVFCSFSGNVLASGLSRANVTGVLEVPYPIQTARLAVSLVPNASRFMVLGDRSSPDAVATETLFEALLKDPPYPAMPIRRQTDVWEEWQAFVQETDTVDFVLLGKHDRVRDASGVLIAPSEVLRWTLLHSTAPVFGLWQDAVTSGAVAGLTLSGEQQGVSAAELVLQIVAGADPAVLLPQRPARNILAVNLSAARHWELQTPFELLVTASFGGTFPEP